MAIILNVHTTHRSLPDLHLVRGLHAAFGYDECGALTTRTPRVALFLFTYIKNRPAVCAARDACLRNEVALSYQEWVWIEPGDTMQYETLCLTLYPLCLQSEAIAYGIKLPLLKPEARHDSESIAATAALAWDPARWYLRCALGASSYDMPLPLQIPVSLGSSYLDTIPIMVPGIEAAHVVFIAESDEVNARAISGDIEFIANDRIRILPLGLEVLITSASGL